MPNIFLNGLDDAVRLLRMEWIDYVKYYKCRWTCSWKKNLIRIPNEHKQVIEGLCFMGHCSKS